MVLYVKVQRVPERQKKNCSSNPSFPTIEIPCNQRSLTWAFSRPSHLHRGNFTLLPFDSQKVVNKQLKKYFGLELKNLLHYPLFCLWCKIHLLCNPTLGYLIRTSLITDVMSHFNNRCWAFFMWFSWSWWLWFWPLRPEVSEKITGRPCTLVWPWALQYASS